MPHCSHPPPTHPQRTDTPVVQPALPFLYLRETLKDRARQRLGPRSPGPLWFFQRANPNKSYLLGAAQRGTAPL